MWTCVAGDTQVLCASDLSGLYICNPVAGSLVHHLFVAGQSALCDGLAARIVSDTVRVWDTVSRRIIFKVRARNTLACALTHGAANATNATCMLATASLAGVAVWDLAAGQVVRTVPLVSESHPTYLLHERATCSFSPAGVYLVVGSAKGFEMWHIWTGKLVFHAAGHVPVFAPDGNRMAVGSNVWHLRGGRAAHCQWAISDPVHRHSLLVLSSRHVLGFHTRGTTAYTTVYSMETGQDICTVKRLWPGALSPDGRFFAGRRQCSVLLCTTSGGVCVACFTTPHCTIEWTFSPCSSFLFCIQSETGKTSSLYIADTPPPSCRIMLLLLAVHRRSTPAPPPELWHVWQSAAPAQRPRIITLG